MSVNNVLIIAWLIVLMIFAVLRAARWLRNKPSMSSGQSRETPTKTFTQLWEEAGRPNSGLKELALLEQEMEARARSTAGPATKSQDGQAHEERSRRIAQAIVKNLNQHTRDK